MLNLSFKNLAPRIDAGDSAFLNRQLEHVLAEVYRTEFADLRFRLMIPVSNEVNPGAKTITYRMYTAVGMFKFLTNGAKDLPRVDIYAKEYTSPVHSFGGAYGFTDDDLLHAAMAGVALESEKGIAARQAAEQVFNATALSGNSNLGLPGFLNNANVTVDTILADGTGTSKAWSTKTPTQIARDVAQVLNLVKSQSKGLYVADTIALPLTRHSYIAMTPWSGNSDTTILTWLKANFPEVKNWEWLNELETAGASSATRMVAYKKDPTVLKAHIPQEFQQYPPQEQGLEVIIPCKGKTGGTLITKPVAVVYADGI
jgi:hypothetical protein